jgi:hypothetical protein
MSIHQLIKTNIAIFVILIAMIYLCVSFYFVTFNISQWSPEGRGACIGFFALAFLLSCLFTAALYDALKK